MTDSGAPRAYKITDRSCYVKIRYTVRVENGPVLKGDGEREVMDFVTGYGHVIPGLERRLVGRCAGEKLSFTVPPEEAFGQRHEELVIEKNRADFHFPPGYVPYPGMELPLIVNASDAPDTAMIREVREDSIIIDLNHALAGLALRYDLEIIEARPARPTDVCSEWEESASGGKCCSDGDCAVLGVGDVNNN
ncbi:MAG: FKBP-type peptidyl-prolyl cis-trans isomerase [Desulfomonilaceae bacterium]